MLYPNSIVISGTILLNVKLKKTMKALATAMDIMLLAAPTATAKKLLHFQASDFILFCVRVCSVDLILAISQMFAFKLRLLLKSFTTDRYVSQKS